MPLKQMSFAEVTAFLERAWPSMLGVIGTIGGNGFPHLVPVWYRFDGTRVHIWTGDQRVWVRNVARTPRVGFSVQEGLPPFAAVTMQGLASLRTGESEEVLQEIEQITRRYIIPDEVENYLKRWRSLRTMVTITPERMRGFWEEE